MPAEVREFRLTTSSFVVRFGLGSTEAVKRWARFELKRSGDLIWTQACDIRRDIDSTNTHISVHKSGEVHSSRYQGERKVHSHAVGNMGASFWQITKPYQVISGSELFEPGFLYYGLGTLTDNQRRQAPDRVFVACLDPQLVNSRLHYSFDLQPWVDKEKVIEYLIEQNRPFALNDPRSHLFTFCWRHVSAVVTMKFTEGDGPIDIQQVRGAGEDIHPLKRFFFEETLALSESARLAVSPRSSLFLEQNIEDGSPSANKHH